MFISSSYFIFFTHRSSHIFAVHVFLFVDLLFISSLKTGTGVPDVHSRNDEELGSCAALVHDQMLSASISAP